MSDVLPELIEPPINDLPIEAIEDVLRDHYGLSGQIFPIEGRQNPYFLIDNGHMRYLLKVAPAEGPLEEIEAEHALMRHILRSPDGPRVPEPVVTRDGGDTLVLPLGGEDRRIRLLTFLDGTAPPSGEKLPDQAVAAFGAISAALAKACWISNIRSCSASRKGTCARPARRRSRFCPPSSTRKSAT
ncbi:phosphotransferase [Neorhizobium galegae]|nr:phosphotransferase [Neorhizobium galegae]